MKRGSFHVAGKKIRTASDVSSQVDTGGGEMDKVRAELVWGIAGAAGVTAAGLGARAAIKTGNPFRGTVRLARSNDGDFVVGEATAKQLMKLRSIDRFIRNADRSKPMTTIHIPSRIKDDPAHLANIRKQNLSSYDYDERTRLYSDDDLSNFSNLFQDIKVRGVQSPVTVGRIKGYPTLLEGNHRVIAQFDINPNAMVPFQVSQRTWDVYNKETKNLARRAIVRAATEKVKKIVPKKR